MNFLLAIFPDSVLTTTEPMAVMLWGIALLLLSTWRPAKSLTANVSPAGQQESKSPRAATVSSAQITIGS